MAGGLSSIETGTDAAGAPAATVVLPAARRRLTTLRGRARLVRWLTRGAASAVVLLALLAVVVTHNPGLVLGRGSIDAATEARGVNPALAASSSVLDLRTDAVSSFAVPARTVALTFDDGPDPTWTPRIQAVLDELGVPGTFFVVGDNVARYPDLVRRLHRAGHEIGSHSFTHAHLGTLAAWQQRQQLALTERVVVAVTGERPVSFRPPYSGQAAYLTDDELAAARRAADQHLGVVLSDLAPRDFDPSVGVDDLVRAATPAPGAGAVITFHDAGGDRSATVEALRRLVPRLQADGYRFVRAAELTPAGARPTPLAAGADARLGRLYLTTRTLAGLAMGALWVAAAAGVVLMLGRSVVMIVLARRQRRVERTRATDLVHEPVTVIIPAYNEEVGIEAAVRSIAASDYPDVRVVVVDDGSSDRTADIVEAIDLPNLRLVRKPNGGKPSALNAGIAAADTDLVVMVDGDTVFEPGTVRALVQPFGDPSVGAVGGNAKVGNRDRLVTKMQHVEYTVASALERRMMARLRVSACIPGAIGAFRMAALRDAGGLNEDTLAEDADLTFAIARAGWAVDYAPDARAWTEVPSTWSGLVRQRRRWSYGVLQTMVKHRRAFVERGLGGRLVRLVVPYQFLVSYLFACLAPLIDLLALWTVAFVPGARVPCLALWLALNLWNAGVNMYALRLDGERMRHGLFVAFVQQLAYRQVLYVAAIRACLAAVLGVRLPWQTPRRIGGVSVHDLLSSPAPLAAALPGGADQ